MKKNNVVILAAGCVACLAALPSYALDGVSFSLGNGNGTDLARASVQWNWQRRWFDSGSWYLGGYWDVSLGYWHSHGSEGNDQDIVDLGATPVFRFRRNNTSGFAPYVEAAIGAHLLSHTYVNARRRFSTAFQFGDHVGVGMVFGEKQQYDIAYIYQHLSNAGIKNPNNGINFNEIRFTYHF
jgi:lipid A 3-O-deacylase